MNFNLNVREEISLELKGYITTEYASELLPEGLEPLSYQNSTPVCLQIAHVDKLNWEFAPFLKMRMDKALWHIATLCNGKKGWYIAGCDISHPLVRHLSNSIFNYPLREASFLFMEKRKSLVTQHQPGIGGEMRCHIELGADHIPQLNVSPCYVNYKNKIHTIEVNEHIPDFCRISKADIIKDEISREVFGYPVEWEQECYVFRGRTFNWKDVTFE